MKRNLKRLLEHALNGTPVQFGSKRVIRVLSMDVTAGHEHNGRMPKYARPADGDGAEGPLAILGNRVMAGIIRQLRKTPDVGRKVVADALQVPASTLVPYLGELEAAGLLLADPPRGERKRGEWVRYRVNDEAVTEIYLRLGQEIGEI